MLDFAPSPQLPRFAFEPHDKVTIGGIEYRAVDVSDTGYVFVRLDGQGIAESFTRAEISRLVDLGRVVHERDALLPEAARARLTAPSELLSTLPAAQHMRARGREGAVLAFLQMEEEGLVNRTDGAVNDMIDAITGRAAKILKGESHYDETGRKTRVLSVPEFKPRSLRRWVKAYERFGISGLFDGMGRQGNRSRRLCVETQKILTRCVQGYLTLERRRRAEFTRT